MFSLAAESPVYFVGVTHFLSLLLMVFLIRSGLEILSSCPKLYWNDDSKPGTEWLRLTSKKLPTHRLWTTLEEEEDWSPWVSLPGHKNLGLGRLWHFLAAGLWIVNGLVYYVLLFVSGEWRRLVPTDWRIIPGALHTAYIYLHAEMPPRGNPYNPLQQLAYFAAAFIFPAFMLLTGLAMSPAVIARFPGFPRLFRNRQTARSLHFLGLIAILGFVVVHVALVLLEGFTGNINYIMFGHRDANTTVSMLLLAGWFVLIVAVQVLATWATLRSQRRAQRALTTVVTPWRRALFVGHGSAQAHHPAKITPALRVNGFPPDTEEFLALQDADFRDWRLRVTGLVEEPLELSLDELRALPSTTQTTLHNCIQGWTGYAQWRGVRVSELLRRAGVQKGARFVIVHSHQWFMGHPFYEAMELEVMDDEQSILAYEMNGKALPIEHGAPVRLRVESLLGFKMVKHVSEIELVSSYELVGQGQGGHREDHRFYGIDAGI